jgi:hypothetical protein
VTRTPKLRRQILLREGQRCANPYCRKTAHQCHHIRLRSHGRPTELWNEVALCSTCHALVHAGRLRVTGRPGEALEWTTAGTTLDRELSSHGDEAGQLPVVQLPSAFPNGGSSGIPDDATREAAAGRFPSPPGAGRTAVQASPAVGTLPPDLLRDLIGGLEKLGFDKVTAKHDLLRAAAELPYGKCTEKTLIEAALEYRRERDLAARRNTGDVRIPAPTRAQASGRESPGEAIGHPPPGTSQRPSPRSR